MSFTDLLDELETQIEAKLARAGLPPEAQWELLGGQALVEVVRNELANRHIVPAAIYRAVGRATASLLQAAPPAAPPAYWAGMGVVSSKLLSKADAMDRHRNN